MKAAIRRAIARSSCVAAGIGVVLSPVPFADEVVLLPLLGGMAIGIGRAHGRGWSELPWGAIGRTAVAGLASRALVNLAVSYVPFVAAAANAASAAALTVAFGAYVDRACGDPASARPATLGDLKVDLCEALDRWRHGRRRETRDASERTP